MTRKIERIMRTAMLAVAFMLCATSAWAAAKPIAVWNGDFTVVSRGGVTVTLNGNSNSDGNLTITDSSSLGTTAGGGVYFEIPSAKRGKHLTTVIGANLSSVDFSATRYLMTFTQGTAQNKVGACLNTSRKFVGIWNGNPWDASTKIGTSVWPTTDTTRYIGYIYNPTAPDTSNSGVYGQDGSRIFVDASSTADYNQSGLRDSGNTVVGVTIGGYRGANSSDLHTKSLTNAKIKFIALFTAGDYATADDVVYWSLTGMSTVSTEVNTTTTTDGVNLPASATLAAAATPAAVFVQQTSTLTVSDGGSLTIGGGTGPLYVADGTTLTIDATGLTSLTALNPSVTLVSGKIYGKDLISVKAPVITGLKVTPTITDTAITLTCATDSVSFTSPFTGNTLAAPATGTGWGTTQTSVSFGNNAKFSQTVGARSAAVADVFAGTYSVVNGLLKASEAATNADMDNYLLVSGGTASIVNGRQTAPWGGTSTASTTGDAIVQLQGDASVDYVFGAGDQGNGTTLTGNAGVTVKGDAVVKGAIVGGWGSSHKGTPLVTGNTAVRIENIQSTNSAVTPSGGVNVCIPNDIVIGGSSLQWNVDSHSTIQGNTSVIVDIATASGSFAKRIVGGSCSANSTTQDFYGNERVGGNSSVTITAPNVTFAKQIVGGGYANNKAGYLSSVGGNSSVTINSGTYTGEIVAGGYAEDGGSSTVAGTATLTLNGGVFTSASLRGGTATRAKTIAVGGDVDLSTTSISGFDTLTVAAAKTLTLGGRRLASNVDPMLTSVGTGGKVAFTLTAAEESAGVAYLAKCLIADTTGKFTIKDSSGADITDSPSYEVTVIDGYLVWIDPQTYTVTVDTETAWDSVIWTCAGSSATMATAATDLRADATITLDGGTLVISDAETFIGNLEITGTGTLKFTGSASLMVSSDLVIGSGVTLDFSGLTNLSNFGSDTIILARNLTVNTSSVSFPSTWTCTSANSSTSFVISGYKNDSDSISVNIIGRTNLMSDEGIAGFFPVRGALWNQIVSEYNTVNETDAISELLAGAAAKTPEAGILATITAPNTYLAAGSSPGNANAWMMAGYLDDSSAATITVRNIPYSEYAVVIYMGTDQTTEKQFRPVSVNGTSYCGSGSKTVPGSSNWGSFASARNNVTLAEGSNFLKVTGLTGSTLSIVGSAGNDGNRCGIAGFQIINTGTRSVFAGTLSGGEAELLPSGTSTGMTKTSTGEWTNGTFGQIVLTNPADTVSTVTIGENITTGGFKIKGAGTVTLAIGAGKTLTVATGKIDLSEFSGTLCVDSTIASSLFAGVSTNGGMVRFLGDNLEFNGKTTLPLGKVAFNSAILKGTFDDRSRTVVVEDGDEVRIDSEIKTIALDFDVRGGSLTMESTDKFWFGINSSFNQTGGTVTYACTGTQTDAGNSNCSIFGYSGSGTTVSISGGTFDMGKSTLNIWQNGSALTLSGNAQFKVKGIMAYGNTGRTVTVGGSSRLILTDTQGLDASLASVTLSGGTIELQETAEIKEPLTLAASTESAVTVAEGKTATLSGGVTGTGTLKLDGAGTIANSTALTNVSAIDLTKGLAVNTAVTLTAGAVLSVGDDDVTIGGAVTQSGTLVIDGSAITSGDPSDTITITASIGTFTVANVSTQNMPGSWTLDTTNSTGTELKLVASEVATVGNNSYATIAAAIAAANSGATKTVTLTSNTGDSSTPVTIPEGVTVNFGSYTLTCGTLTVGSGVVVNMANISATKVEGSGTVVYDGSSPTIGLGWTDADNWNGTLWVKNYGSLVGSSFEPNNYGNINSTLKFSSVKGWYYAIKTSDTTTEFNPAIELGDDGEYALWLSDGWGYNSGDNSYYSPVSELKGNGLLKGTGNAVNVTLLVKKWDDFGGSLDLANKVVVFGSVLPTQASIEGGGYVIVNSGSSVVVKSGKTWTATKGFVVSGDLAVAGSGCVSGPVTVEAAGTLDLSGFTGTGSAISGSLTLASGTTIKLPAGATLPYQLATSGDGGLIDNVTVQIGDEAAVNGTVALRGGAITSLAPVAVNAERTYTLSEVFGTPSASSSYEISVTADAALNIDSAITVDIVKFNVAANKTLTLTGAALTANQIYVYGAGKVSVSSATALSGTIKGDGTLQYVTSAAPSGVTFTSSDWSGTLWIKGATITDLKGADLGSSASTLRLTGVQGYAFYGDTTSKYYESPCTIDLQDDGNTKAFALSDGYGDYRAVYKALTGAGTFQGDSHSQYYIFKNASAFEGALTTSSGGTRIILGNATSLTVEAGTITVPEGYEATIKTGKVWTAPGGLSVGGSLKVEGTGSVSGSVSLSEGGTLDLSGFGGETPAISGSLTLNGGVIKLPADAVLPYRIAASGDGAPSSCTIGDTTRMDLLLKGGELVATRTATISTESVVTFGSIGWTGNGDDYTLTLSAPTYLTFDDTKVDALKIIVENGVALFVKGDMPENTTIIGLTPLTIPNGVATYYTGYTRLYSQIGTTENGNGALDASGTIEVYNAAAPLEAIPAGSYTLARWLKPQKMSTGYGSVGTLTANTDTHSKELVYCADSIALRVWDETTQSAKPTLKIMPYGDSITEGYNNGATKANYRVLLAQKLSLAGYNVKMVGAFDKIQTDNGSPNSMADAIDPAGQTIQTISPDWKWHSAKHGGTVGVTSLTSYQRSAMVENVDTLCAQAGTPDAVLLLGGINDLSPGYAPPASVFANWKVVVGKLVSNLPNTKILVATTLHASPARKDALNDNADAFNTLVKNYMKDEMPDEWDGHVYLVDLCDAVKSADEGTITTDNLHPDWWGHNQMAQAWFEKITELYPNPSGTFPSATVKTAPTSDQLGAANKTELASYRAGFTRYGVIEVGNNKSIDTVAYANEDPNAATEGLTKVGYFVEYVRDDNNEHRWVWVDMDAFGSTIGDVGLPTAKHQQVVTKLHVRSNHPGIENVAADDDSVTGWIEFTPFDYTGDSSGVSGAPLRHGAPTGSYTMFDWDDTLSTSEANVDSGANACMQVFRKAPATGRPAQTLFAFNNWRSTTGAAEFGIGNFAQHFWGGAQTFDYTKTRGLEQMNASAYSVKTIEIWTKAAYTAELSADSNFSDLIFSPELPNDISASDLIINVTANARLTSDSSLEAGSIKLNISEGATLTLNANAVISEVTGAGTLEIGAGRTVTLTSNTALDGIASLTGTGTLVLPIGTAPSTSGLTDLLDNDNWQGAVVLTGYEATADMPLASYGNVGSKIKFMGVKARAISQTVDAELVLENGEYEYALWIIQASDTNQNNLNKISGTGTIKADGNFQQVYAIRNSVAFTGSIHQAGTSGGRIYFSTGRNSQFISGSGMIAVDDSSYGATSATIGDGNYWYGGNCTDGNNDHAGIQVKGTVILLGAATMTAGGEKGVMFHGGATLKLSGDTAKYLTTTGTLTWPSSGTVTIDASACASSTVKIPVFAADAANANFSMSTVAFTPPDGSTVGRWTTYVEQVDGKYVHGISKVGTIFTVY